LFCPSNPSYLTGKIAKFVSFHSVAGIGPMLSGLARRIGSLLALSRDCNLPESVPLLGLQGSEKMLNPCECKGHAEAGEPGSLLELKRKKEIQCHKN
jgi:hypothetical protein